MGLDNEDVARWGLASLSQVGPDERRRRGKAALREAERSQSYRDRRDGYPAVHALYPDRILV